MQAPLHLFDKTATVQRAAETQDSGGGPILTFANHLTGVKCRVQPLNAAEAVGGSRPGVTASYAVYAIGGQDITEKDRLIIGSTTYEVTGVRDYDLQEVLMRLDCELVR